MTAVRRAGCFVLLAVYSAVVAPGLLARHDYSAQFRDHADEAPSREFILGTDDLGRDRWSRLLYGARVSLLFAPATAFLAVSVGAILGIAAGSRGGWVDNLLTVATDLFLALPWLFLLLTLRGMMPLDVSAVASLSATGLLLASVGWAHGARVIRAAASHAAAMPYVRHARACGCSPGRILLAHILPGVAPVILAQFWILVPVFLLTEANLGLLGLGLSEPLPSIGNLLAELRHYERIPEAPWLLAPALLLVSVVTCLHLVIPEVENWA